MFRKLFIQLLAMFKIFLLSFFFVLSVLYAQSDLVNERIAFGWAGDIPGIKFTPEIDTEYNIHYLYRENLVYSRQFKLLTEWRQIIQLIPGYSFKYGVQIEIDQTTLAATPITSIEFGPSISVCRSWNNTLDAELNIVPILLKLQEGIGINIFKTTLGIYWRFFEKPVNHL